MTFELKEKESVSLTGEKKEPELIETKKSVKNDIWNILFLMFLYFLQGIPTGLYFSISFILSDRKATYSDQGTFTLSAWPYTLKLLWAPFVDAWYLKSIGRRKSWLVPSQIMMGALLIAFAPYIHRVLGVLTPGVIIHDGIKNFLIKNNVIIKQVLRFFIKF